MPEILKIPVHGLKQVNDQSLFLPLICFQHFVMLFIYTHLPFPPVPLQGHVFHQPWSCTVYVDSLHVVAWFQNEKLWCVFETGELGVGGLRGSHCTTVDGSEIRLTHQLRLVVFPVIQRFFYIPGGAGFPPSNGTISLLHLEADIYYILMYSCTSE